MGTTRDMRQRTNGIRIDTEAIQFDIERTRSWIFEDGHSASSKRITMLLGARSLLPIRVRTVQCSQTNMLTTLFAPFRLGAVP